MTKEPHTLNELLNKVIPICTYRGCTISLLVGGYSVLGQKCKTPFEVDEIIDTAERNLEASIFKSETTLQK